MDKDKKDILSSGFRTKFEDYELPVREDLWTEIERDLPTEKTVVRNLWRVIGSVAASIALILSLSWGIFKTLNKPVSDIAKTEISEPLTNQNNMQIVHEVVETKGESDPVSLVKGSPKPLYAHIDPNVSSVISYDDTSEIISSAVSEEENREPGEESDQNLPIEEPKNEIISLSDLYIADLWEDSPRSKKKNDMSFALAYSNQGRGNFATPTSDPLLRYAQLFNSVSTVNEEESLDNVSISDTEYKTPITFSLSVRKALSEKWAIESGLAYTYLESSEKKTYTTGEIFSDTYELSYLGLPVRLVYSIYNRGNLAIYASGGGMVEKCIYTRKISSENHSKTKPGVPELQWSIGGNVGISYEMIQNLSLFAEPGINYYFDDKNEIPTIRKDKPLNFNLQLGIRLDI